LNDAKGRDHWPLVRSGLFAGGGVRHACRIMGATDDAASKIARFDWAKGRAIYSVLGVDWTEKISACLRAEISNTSSRLRQQDSSAALKLRNFFHRAPCPAR
jgi:hypothetical protein